jgi:hypothetical protein
MSRDNWRGAINANAPNPPSDPYRPSLLGQTYSATSSSHDVYAEGPVSFSFCHLTSCDEMAVTTNHSLDHYPRRPMGMLPGAHRSHALSQEVVCGLDGLN